ncbi:unnamed protein product [Ilex paraguariensis]|uniref:Oxidative stress 3 n=1 Tax=Ilex paraguariensis TaxID=185542 RepID=A0ABC8TYI0_9AQUA
MGEGKRVVFQSSYQNGNGNKEEEDNWEIMEGDDNSDTTNHMISSLNFAIEDPTTSDESSSSLDMADDASSSSSPSSSSSSPSSGPLYDLSELMTQLPIKRGLSKYYQGKSQSYACLSRVKSIEDLAKKEVPYRRKMKSCKSYAGGLDAYKSYTLPKPIISKKASKSSLPSSFPSRRGSFSGSCRPPLIPE